MNLTQAHEHLSKFLNSQPEWLLIDASGKTFALGKNEIETAVERGRMLLSFLDDKGFQTWRIAAFEQKNTEIVLDLTRNFEKECRKIRFVPRVAAEELGAAVAVARLEKANRIAALLHAPETPPVNAGRVGLDKENGRFVRIIFEQNRTKTAALADVSATATAENHLSGAILWLTGLEKRRRHPVAEVWILAGKKIARRVQKLHALLNDDWRRKIKVLEIFREDAKVPEKDKADLKIVKKLRIEDLWRGKPAKLALAENARLSRTAREIIRLAPARIDHIFTRQGETLRFSGLPFARVRKTLDRERCWFGIEREKRILSEKTQEDFEKLVADLETYRRFDAAYKRHEFYRLAPEAWLESILRKNIRQLDANLILSPVFNQFRAARDRIDLLALRRDGRLVIIELKVAPDREMIFQAIDYWRQIELQRRSGMLDKVRLFGDRQIADRPALVYLVAPTLSYHRDFQTLAGTISPEIEIYRFDLAENWRERVRVLRREKTF